MLGRRALVGREASLDELPQAQKDLPDRDFSVCVLVEVRRRLAAQIGERVRKLGFIQLLVGGRRRDHDTSLGRECFEETAGGGRRDQEDLFAASDSVEQLRQLVVAKVWTGQVQEDVPAAFVGMPQDDHPQPVLGRKPACEWRSLLARSPRAWRRRPSGSARRSPRTRCARRSQESRGAPSAIAGKCAPIR